MESYLKLNSLVYFLKRVVGNKESKKAQEEMVEEIDGLGVSPFHEKFPSVK